MIFFSRNGLLFCYVIIFISLIKFVTNINLQSSSGIRSVADKKLNQNWLKNTINKVCHELRPYEVTIWYSSDFSLTDMRHVIAGEFPKHHQPASQFDGAFWTKHFSKIPYLYSTSGSGNSINIFVADKGKTLVKNIYFKVFEILSRVVNVRSQIKLLPCSKILIILVQNFKHSSKERNSLNLFFSWVRKIHCVDVTIIIAQKDQKQTPYIIHQDVIDNTSTVSSLNNNSVLFPDKITNMKGQKFVTVYQTERLFKEQAEIYMNSTSIFRMTWYTPSTFVHQFFCVIHNCTATLVMKDSSEFFQSNNWRLYLTNNLNSASYVHIFFSFFFDVKAAVPHLDQEIMIARSFHHENILVFFMILVMILIIIKLMRKSYRIRPSEFSMINILKCILGSSRRFKRVLKFGEKIFYLALITLSFNICNELVDFATSFKLEVQRKSIETIKDIYELKVPIWSPYGPSLLVGDQILSKKDFDCKNMSVRISCLWELSEKNDRICIDRERVIRTQSSKIKAAKGKGVRITSVTLQRRYLGVEFPKGSFYGKAYTDLFSRLLSMGIIRQGNVQQEIEREQFGFDIADYDIIDNRQSDFYWSLFNVMSGIYLLALLILLIEKLVKTREIAKFRRSFRRAVIRVKRNRR